MQPVTTNSVALGLRQRCLLLAGEFTGLMSILVTGMAVALWPSDPMSPSAFVPLIDIPFELVDYLQSWGMELEASAGAALNSTRMPNFAYSACLWLLVLTAVGAALRARWALFFAAQLLLTIPLTPFVAVVFTGGVCTYLYILAAGRALIGRKFLLAGVFIALAFASDAFGDFAAGVMRDQVPTANKIVTLRGTPTDSALRNFYATRRFEKFERLIAKLDAAPAELKDAAAYVRAQASYTNNDPKAVSAELRILDPSKFSHGKYTMKRLTVMREFVDAHAGVLASTVLAKALSATVGVLSLIIVITALALTRLAAALKQRIGRIEVLSGKVTELKTVSA